MNINLLIVILACISLWRAGSSAIVPDYDLSNLATAQGFKMASRGTAVSSAGDCNGDGIDDVIVGAFWVSGETGITYVIFGNRNPVTTGLDLVGFTTGPTTGFRILSATGGDNGGHSVSKAGDVNGDGVDDVIMGAPCADPSGSKLNAGIAYVIFGRKVSTAAGNAFTDIQLPTTVMAAGVGFRILGAAANDKNGVSVSGAGDVNGDGIHDVIVGSFAADPPNLPTNSDAGIAYVVFGKNMSGIAQAFGDVDFSTIASGSQRAFRVLGSAAGDYNGWSVSKAGDVNNDGVDDVIVGAIYGDHPGQLNAGISYVIFGRKVSIASGNAFVDIQLTTTSLAPSVGFRILGAAGGDASGYSVNTAGDVNGDGVDDIIIGSVQADPPMNADAGISYVLFGRTMEIGVAPYGDVFLSSISSGSTFGFRILGVFVLDNSGCAVSSAGDINGDGISDIIVGAPLADPGGQIDAGIAYVIYGRKSNAGSIVFNDVHLATFAASSLVGFRITGIAADDRIGRVVNNAGDFNGDGVDDIIVGSYMSSSYVIYGIPANPTSQPSSQPSREPSRQPSQQPSQQPTVQPSQQPSSQPTRQPSAQPSRQPSSQPSARPTTQPTAQPSRQPSQNPTSQPTVQPTTQPITQPSAQPTSQPLSEPTTSPSDQPSGKPSMQPSRQPSSEPSLQPTAQPMNRPTSQPSAQPTIQPSSSPTSQPSPQPTSQPSKQPTCQPSSQPISLPSVSPSMQPTASPTMQPSAIPSFQPTTTPTSQPSMQPSTQPSSTPSAQPIAQPTLLPSIQPTAQPSQQPAHQPSKQPTSQPSNQPSLQPNTLPSRAPSSQPSAQPSAQPSTHPSVQPGVKPSTQPSSQPSATPSLQPSSQPSSVPSWQASVIPSAQPSSTPSGQTSCQPSSAPTCQPTKQPSEQPTPRPSSQPSEKPSKQPTSQPSRQPRATPTSRPSASPTGRPTVDPHIGAWVTPLSSVLTVDVVATINDTTWACGMKGSNRASCTVVDATTGLFTSVNDFVWTGIASITQISDLGRVFVTGRSVDLSTPTVSHAADCTLRRAQPVCTVTSYHDTSFSAATYVPFPNKIMYVGLYNVYTSASIVDVLTGTTSTFTYTYQALKLVELLHVRSPPNYVGGFVAGTGVSSSGAINYIVAGIIRTDSGSMTAMYLTPVSGHILNEAELVNTMALEYEYPDSFIAGALQLSDGSGMHAYLLRANVLFGSVKFCMRYRTSSMSNATSMGTRRRRALSEALQITSVTRGMVRIGTALFMTVDLIHNNNIGRTSLTVLKVDINTGHILQQVHVTAHNASLSCSDIAASSTGLFLYIGCNVQRSQSIVESIIIATDILLRFGQLPSGFSLQTQAILQADSVPFKRTAITVTSKSTQMVTDISNSSTTVDLPSVHPSVTPTHEPSFQLSSTPSGQPSSSPTAAPSVSPQPTSHPSSSGPTNTYKPTVKPTQRPSAAPSQVPTVLPTVDPTVAPIARPTQQPSERPSTQPSVMSTATPTSALTAKLSTKPSAEPSLRSTRTPSVAASAIVAASATGGTRLRPNDSVMIFVYVVGGLTAIWCAYQLQRCCLNALEKRKKTMIIKAHLEAVCLLTTKQPPHEPHLPMQTKQYGAYANSAIIGAPALNAVCGLNGVGSDQSASIEMSSLHSSEMSDISYSVHSDEQDMSEPTIDSQLHTSTRESAMEEGNTNFDHRYNEYDTISSNNTSEGNASSHRSGDSECSYVAAVSEDARSQEDFLEGSEGSILVTGSSAERSADRRDGSVDTYRVNESDVSASTSGENDD